MRLPVILGLMFIAAWAPRLGARLPWRDEAATLLFASYGPIELWHATDFVDKSSFLYYLVVSPLSRLPDPLLAIRAVSLLAGALAVIFTADMAKRFWGNTGAVIVGLFLVMNPALFDYPIVARSYLPTAALWIISTWLLVASSDRTHSKARWLVYTAVVCSAVGFNILSSPVLASHFIWALLTRRLSIRLWLSWILAFLLGLTIFILSFNQSNQLSWVEPYGEDVLVRAGIIDPCGGGTLLPLLTVAGAAMAVTVTIAKRRLNECLAFCYLCITGWLLPGFFLLTVSALVYPVYVARYVLVRTFFCALLSASLPSAIRSLIDNKHLESVISAVTVLSILVASIFTPAGDETTAEGMPHVARDIGWYHEQEPLNQIAVYQAYAQTGTLEALAAGFGSASMSAIARELPLQEYTGWIFMDLVGDGWEVTQVDSPHGRVVTIEVDPENHGLTDCEGGDIISGGADSTVRLWECPLEG